MKNVSRRALLVGGAVSLAGSVPILGNFYKPHLVDEMHLERLIYIAIRDQVSLDDLVEMALKDGGDA